MKKKINSDDVVNMLKFLGRTVTVESLAEALETTTRAVATAARRRRAKPKRTARSKPLFIVARGRRTGSCAGR